MKLQNLTVIFIIIIIPVILLVSLYITTGLKTLKYQALYDTGLMSATHDAIFAFEQNTSNDQYSNNPEIKRDILKSSIKMFEKSLANTCSISSYNAEEIEEYIPAIVFGMYDGFYMYAPSKEYMGEDAFGNDKYEYKHNLKNYVYYSETVEVDVGAVKEKVIIRYTLDNYVTVTGSLIDEDGEQKYLTKGGYLAVGSSENGMTYQGNDIEEEAIEGHEDDGINYYKDAYKFTNWFNTNIGDQILHLKIGIGNDPEDENSAFVQHKRSIMRSKIEGVLNSSITAYSERTWDKVYKMPKLAEEDWDKIYSNISMITFFQGKNIGLTRYNGYCVLNSTNNKEYVNSNLMYFIKGEYYHDIRCNHLLNDYSNGYRIGKYEKIKVEQIDALGNSILGEDGEVLYKYVYEHNKMACYDCINGMLQNSESLYDYVRNSTDSKIKTSYYTSLGRERYNGSKTISYIPDQNEYASEAELAKIDLTGKILWNDSNNRDGKRPESIEVQLLKNGIAEGSPVTLYAGNNWAYEWELDKYDENRNEIPYTIKIDEASLPTEYQLDIYREINSNENNKIITIQLKSGIEFINKTVEKVWNDNNNQDGRRGRYKVTLFANGTKVGEANIDDPDITTYTFANLYKYSDGEIINYTIQESILPEGYEATITDDGDGNKFTIINTHIPTTINKTVEKIWNDNNNQDGKRGPYQITLYANGEEKEVVNIDNPDTTTYTFEGLPEYKDGIKINYTIAETKVPEEYKEMIRDDNEGNKFTITNTYIPKTISKTVEKIWNDNNNQDGKRGAYQITLYADGEERATVNIDNPETTTYTFEGLPEYKDGKKIDYAIQETTIPEGYESAIIDDGDGDRFTITNTHVPTTINKTVEKVWDDNNNQDGKRGAYQITLYANGEEKDKVTIENPEDTIHKFEGLPEYENGTKINYTIVETSIPEGYESEIIDDGDGDTFKITNKHIPETISKTVTKIWDDDNNQDGRREFYEITLYAKYADEEEIEIDRITIEDPETTTYTFEGLTAYKDGKKIDYRIEETRAPDLYEPTITDDGDGNEFIIVNKYTPETVDKIVEKIWDDTGNEEKRDSYQVILYADGEEYDRTTIDDLEDTTFKFEKLPVFKNGKLIDYSIEETNIPEGYEAQISDDGNRDTFKILNKYIPPVIDITVKKVWDDNDDTEKRGSYGLTLKANGEKVADTIITDPNTETFTFTGFFESENGKEIRYTVEETTIPAGYEATIEEDATEENTFIITNKYVLEDEEKTVRVSYIKDGKEIFSEIIENPDNYNYKIKQLDGIDKTYYSFKGWQYNIDGNIYQVGDNIEYSSGIEEIVLTATYEQKQAKLIFDPNLPAGVTTYTGTLPQTLSKHMGDTVALTPYKNVIRIDDYELIGWHTTQNETSGLSSVTLKEEVTTVYAIWAKYIVEFDNNKYAYLGKLQQAINDKINKYVTASNKTIYTIKLLDNVSGTIYLSEPSNIGTYNEDCFIIDLNDKTYTGKIYNEKDNLEINGGKNKTGKFIGKLELRQGIDVAHTHNLVLKDVNFDAGNNINFTEDGTNNYSGIWLNDYHVTITDSIITSNSNSYPTICGEQTDITINNSTIQNNGTSNAVHIKLTDNGQGTLIINGANSKIISKGSNPTVWLDDESAGDFDLTLTMNDGEIINNSTGTAVTGEKGCNIKIIKGTIRNTGDKDHPTIWLDKDADSTTKDLEMTGGTIINDGNGSAITVVERPRITISNGKIQSNGSEPTIYLGEDDNLAWKDLEMTGGTIINSGTGSAITAIDFENILIDGSNVIIKNNSGSNATIYVERNKIGSRGLGGPILEIKKGVIDNQYKGGKEIYNYSKYSITFIVTTWYYVDVRLPSDHGWNVTKDHN